MLDRGLIGLSISVKSLSCFDLVLPAFDFSVLEALPPLRSAACLGSIVLVFGLIWFELPFPVLDLQSMDSLLSLRSLA